MSAGSIGKAESSFRAEPELRSLCHAFENAFAKHLSVMQGILLEIMSCWGMQKDIISENLIEEHKSLWAFTRWAYLRLPSQLHTFANGSLQLNANFTESSIQF